MMSSAIRASLPGVVVTFSRIERTNEGARLREAVLAGMAATGSMPAPPNSVRGVYMPRLSIAGARLSRTPRCVSRHL
jgi:hypothetical protein